MKSLPWKCGSVILFFIHLCVSLDVNISHKKRIGSSLINVGLGPEWTYTVDRLKSTRWITSIVKLTDGGGLKLSRKPDCKLIAHNPAVIFVTAVSVASSSYVIIPIKLHFSGKHCHTAHTKTRTISSSIVISTRYDIEKGACLDTNDHILSVKTFIPLLTRHSEYDLRINSDKQFHIDRLTGNITTMAPVCMFQDLWKIDILLESLQSGTDIIPITLLIFPKQKSWSHVQRHRAQQVTHRMRRSLNNHSPRFARSEYFANVQEGMIRGTSVISIIASDSDYTNADGHLQYSMSALADGRSQNMFEINPATGWIKTKVVLDRESMPEHHFQIFAEDDGSPRRTATTSLRITVSDINDKTPTFENSQYNEPVMENIAVGSTILTVRAFDQDAGPNREIVYSIANPGPPNDVFHISDQGAIKIVKALDRETRESYSLIIHGRDSAVVVSERKTGTTTVKVTVQDVNDNVPQFSESSYTFQVSEGLDPTTGTTRPVIGTITATDADAATNGHIRYSIYSGDSDSNFDINQSTGQLMIRKKLDRESNPSYSLIVRAQDLGSRVSRSNTTNVLIIVTDINDHTPTFDQGSFQTFVHENCANNSEILEVQAFDYDINNNGLITYTIEGAPPGTPFYVDSSGMLRSKAVVDREKIAVYSFRVKASDNGVPRKTAVANVIITVIDENDEAPEFEQDLYNGQVMETASIGSSVLTVKAIDKDTGLNARVTYSIMTGNVGNAFKMRTLNGAGRITVNQRLNYKNRDRYSLFIKAFDTNNNQNTVNVIIKVIDENNHSPSFQNFQYHTTVDENVRTGSSIFKVSAEDADDGDNGRITYSMDVLQEFRIDPDTGIIYVIGSLDRETQQSYAIGLTAEDNGIPKKFGQSTLEITVKDVNDNSPEFVKARYSAHIPENAYIDSSVVRIKATDSDQSGLMNSQVYYTFQGGDNGNGCFSIDPTDGLIRVSKRLDRETVARYNLKAFAVDRGVPARSTSVMIDIDVDDVNDNSPDWQLEGSEGLQLFVQENSPVGTVVDQISASDSDEGENAKVEYRIFSGRDMDKFSLSDVNGVVQVVTQTEMDYESDEKEYHFEVQASSGNLFSNVKVTVNVVDMNDNIPQLNNFKIVFNNYKDHFLQGNIGRVPAWDDDERDRLKYEFISGNSAGLLILDEDTGAIQMHPRLNTDLALNGSFQVRVSDGKNDVSARCELEVRLVTQEMLENSITVRLGDMSASLFLSGLYSYFVTALAAIIPSEEHNVFIFNIRNDTDVMENILNVSFSVWKGRDQYNQDVYHDSQFLSEKVYLNRITINKLSTMNVLPFDDNLCITELCLNYKECRTALQFGAAAPFVSSRHMLFRSIYPEDQYRCVCPDGFTGLLKEEMCDTEVNLCYSNPCQNNGTCSSREGGYACICVPGFAGDHCQYDMRESGKQYTSCPAGLCKAPSRCVTLIKGGLRCEDCPVGEEYNDFCQLRSRSFTPGGFLMYPSLKRRHRFKFELKFATRHRNGLLYYNGRYNNENDFVALELVDGDIRFAFNLGSPNTTYVTLPVKHGANDGKWHHVTVHYFNRTATVAMGEDCDMEVALRYGQGSSSYPCAIQGRVVLQDKCRQSFVSCARFLDLTGPLHLGGLPEVSRVDKRVTSYDYNGCLKDIYIDDDFLDLNEYAYKTPSGTVAGCSQKDTHCSASTCANQGTCVEGWGEYFCLCRPGYGGKDCSSSIDQPVRLTGNGYLLFTSAPSIQLPWFNGIAFRTIQDNSLLMRISAGSVRIDIKIVDGYINYVHPQKTAVLDITKVNDGNWHYFESRWLASGELQMILDYDQVKKSVPMEGSVIGLSVSTVLVGGIKSSSGVTSGFKGCLKNIHVGRILSNPSKENPGSCSTTSACDNNPCPSNSFCVEDWGSDKGYTCDCQAGYHGSRCDNICRNFNPCHSGSTCLSLPSSSHGYTCSCPDNRFGQYCEKTRQACPASWWGYPVCGPCLCDGNKGFNTSCDKKTGECHCKSDHYQPTGSSRCYPCNCYSTGSYNNTCAKETGQCYCRPGVLGKTCAGCANDFAEVTLNGCEVQYSACPKKFEFGILWMRTSFNMERVQKCPAGAVGSVSRYCNESTGWSDNPQMGNCTSLTFLEAQSKRDQLRSGLQVNTYEAKNIINTVNNATQSTAKFYVNDVEIAAYLLLKVLHYESNQTGLNLTHTQDKRFMEKLINSTSHLLDSKNRHLWEDLSQSNNPQTAELLSEMEQYLANLVHNMATYLSTAIMRPFNLVTTNIVLGLDTFIPVGKNSSVSIPKYDNVVKDTSMFDVDTRVWLPSSVFDSVRASSTGKNNKAVAGYVMYKSIGDLLPRSYSDSGNLRVHDNLSVNVPVFTLKLQYGDTPVSGPIPAPVTLDFNQLVTQNRTSPQCVYWHIDNSSISKGFWSDDGCSLKERRNGTNGKRFLSCECNHLTSFAALMDVSDKEYRAPEALALEVVTYIGLSVSLVCLVVTLIIFCLLHRLRSNAISIHINLVICIFISELFFMVGINRTQPELLCKVIAIVLHFFYMCTFSWLFVEGLHIYRMLTEIRNINRGGMKVYYVIGYVVPGIVVGLAVGLSTDGYGNRRFCWLSTGDLLIWSFAGPICLVVAINIIIFAMSVGACCKTKSADADDGTMKSGLKAGIILLPLLATAWVFGLLSVNDDELAFHYLFAIVTCLQGVFILVAHLMFSKQVRAELKRCCYVCIGKKGFEDTIGLSRTTRSALAYTHDSSLDGGLNKMNIGISTSSTTSRTTSKSSGVYRPSYYQSTSTSTNGPSLTDMPPNAGIPPYGYDSSLFHNKGVSIDAPDTGENGVRRHPGDSDSDSDLSINADLDLASSHSSDDDDDDQFDNVPRWDHFPKNKALDRVKSQTPGSPKTPQGLVHSTPYHAFPPPSYQQSSSDRKVHWQGDDEVMTSPKRVQLPPLEKPPMPGSREDVRGSQDFPVLPPERVDSLPSHDSSNHGSPALSRPPPVMPRPPMGPAIKSPSGQRTVKVLTHNGSISSDSDHETSV